MPPLSKCKPPLDCSPPLRLAVPDRPAGIAGGGFQRRSVAALTGGRLPEYYC